MRDTGIGIAEAERERIFEAFQRGGRAARTSTEGTGLGLTLSRRIIDLHGGRLWMESELGVGSTFSFAIPVGHRGAAGSLARRRPDAGARGRPRAASWSWKTTAAPPICCGSTSRAPDTRSRSRATALEGLEMARRLAPRAVILDILLPGLSGWEVLARLKGDPATAAIPVVIASMLDERGTGFALGAAEYLVKPVDREELLEALGALRLAASRTGAR